MADAHIEGMRDKLSRYFALRMRGAPRRQSAETAGLPFSAIKGGRHRCRTEVEIRTDLARQLEGIVKRFEESVGK